MKTKVNTRPYCNVSFVPGTMTQETEKNNWYVLPQRIPFRTCDGTCHKGKSREYVTGTNPGDMSQGQIPGTCLRASPISLQHVMPRSFKL